MLTKVHRLHLKYVKEGKWVWDAELQRKSRKILEGLDNYVAYRHFKFFENVRIRISISQHHIPGTASGHGSHKKFEDLCCAELVNHILEPIKKRTDIIVSS
jgi:hypothetical protein